MEATRDHLNGDLEVGYADVLQPHVKRATAHHAAPPMWLQRWEDSRPRLLTECFAEFLGVFIYVFCGIGASAAFFTTSAAKVTGFGSLLNISLAYAVGIIIAITVCGPASGGHLSPCYTLAFWMFKGFPTRKVPFYIISQIFGGFVAAITVYGIYKQQLDEVTLALNAAGEGAAVFTPQGPAGVFALFMNPGQNFGYVFLGEFVANIFLAITVFSVLDASNIFVYFTTAPFLIGLAYFAMIVCFAPNSLALNTARDLGGRFAGACIWGTAVFPAKYTAIASLTNLLATPIGAAIQTLLLSDSARPIMSMPPDAEKQPSLRVLTRDGGAASNQRVISRSDEKVGGVNNNTQRID